MLNEKHHRILTLIAAGYDYPFILANIDGTHPRDIYDAAQAALDLLQSHIKEEPARQTRRDRHFPRSGLAWTIADIQMLTSLHELKAESSDMAKQLQRTRSEIRAQLIQMGLIKENWHELARKKYLRHGLAWNNDELAALWEEFKSGLSIGELAAKHQRSNYAIQKKLEVLGLIVLEEKEVK